MAAMRGSSTTRRRATFSVATVSVCVRPGCMVIQTTRPATRTTESMPAVAMAGQWTRERRGGLPFMRGRRGRDGGQRYRGGGFDGTTGSSRRDRPGRPGQRRKVLTDERRERGRLARPNRRRKAPCTLQLTRGRFVGAIRRDRRAACPYELISLVVPLFTGEDHCSGKKRNELSLPRQTSVEITDRQVPVPPTRAITRNAESESRDPLASVVRAAPARRGSQKFSFYVESINEEGRHVLFPPQQTIVSFPTGRSEP